MMKPFHTVVKFDTEEGYKVGLVVQIINGRKLRIRDKEYRVWEIYESDVTVI